MYYSNIINESLIFNNSDLILNLEDWGKEFYSNILWITGFSGSGKSTVAYEYSDEDTYIIQLDYFHHFQYSEKPNSLERFIYKKVPEYKEIAEFIYYGEKEEYDYITPDLDTVFIMVLNSILQWSEKVFKKGKKVICEGFQLYNFVPFSFIDGQPIIIKGTSALNSFIRRMKRDNGFDKEYDQGTTYQILKKYFTWYNSDNAKLKALKKHIKMNKDLWNI